MADTKESRAKKLRGSFSAFLGKVNSCDKATFDSCFEDLPADQVSFAYAQFIQLTAVWRENSLEEFDDICAEIQLSEALGRLEEAIESQRDVKEDGVLVSVSEVEKKAKEALRISEEHQIADCQQGIDLEKKRMEEMKAEEDRLRGQLATKMAEGVEIETVYNNASQEARQQQEALQWASRASSVQRRKSQNAPTAPVPSSSRPNGRLW